ncbi:MAG TPA: hypothetical protein VGN07_09980 [Steroidobacteraceae bacterium]
MPPLSDKPRDKIYFSRLGPSQSELFIASLDGTHERQLLPSSSVDYNASFSKDGQWVVFTSERAGSSDIYRVRTDGTGLERLTDSPWFDDQAALSPDGRTVAFVSTREHGTADIWLLDLRTRRSRNLTHGSGGNFRPSWSPDGKTIAFTSDRGEPHRRNDPIWELMHFTALYTMNTDGLGLRRLTPVDEVAESPKWSLDGNRIIYTHRTDDQHPRQIIAITLQTGAKEMIVEGLPGGPSVSPQYISDREVAYTTAGTLRYTSDRQGSDPIHAIHPTWSPDATEVVYERMIAEPSATTPVIAANSINPRFELFRTGSFATFSSDGRQFLVSGNLLPSGNRSIAIMDASGANPRTIFQDNKLGVGGTSWSSDGSLIAFGLGGFFERPVTPARLATIRSDGSDFRVLIQGNGSSGLPSFAPDGGRLVFRALGKDDQGLRILSLADMKPSTLTTAWDNFPSWSPCGDRIAFTRQVAGDFEIFTIKADGTDLRQLTHDHGNDAHSTWSPDGQWIMFASSRMGRKDDDPAGQQPYGELFAIRADGTELQQITDNRWEDVTGAWLTSNGLPRDEPGCERTH